MVNRALILIARGAPPDAFQLPEGIQRKFPYIGSVRVVDVSVGFMMAVTYCTAQDELLWALAEVLLSLQRAAHTRCIGGAPKKGTS